MAAFHRHRFDELIIYTNDCTDGTEHDVGPVQEKRHRSTPRQSLSENESQAASSAALQAAEQEKDHSETPLG